MSAPACGRCLGAPHRYDAGCARCDDSGTGAHEQEPPRRPLIGQYAIERAESELLDALRRHRALTDAHRRAQAARVLAWCLATEPAPTAVLPAVRGWTGLGESEAREVVLVYCRAIEEHAQAVRSSAAYRSESERMAREREARGLEAHAVRVAMCLPRWMIDAA